MTKDRYTVEQGTDGSYLLVDHGEHRDQRTAIERMTDEGEARLEARTLSALEDVTSKFTPKDNEDPWWSETMALVEGMKLPNYDHLLP